MKSLINPLKFGDFNIGNNNLLIKNLEIKAFSVCLGISLYLLLINKEITLHIYLIESGIRDKLYNKSSINVSIKEVTFIKSY